MKLPAPAPSFQILLAIFIALLAGPSALAQGSPVVDTTIPIRNTNFNAQIGQVISDIGPLGDWTVTPSNNNRGAIHAERFNGQGTTPSRPTAGYLEHSASFPNGISFSQELSSVAPGFALTLRYYHGAINVEPTAAADYRVEMSVGGETFFSRVHSLTPKQVNWQQVTETVVVPAHLSGPVTLRFAAVDLDNDNATFSRVCIDDVSLDATPGPEPTAEANAKLVDLVVSEKPAYFDPPVGPLLLPEPFHPDILDYDAEVFGRDRQIVVKPTAAQPGAKITVSVGNTGGGQIVASGTFSTPIDISATVHSSRTIFVKVESPDRTTLRRYRIELFRLFIEDGLTALNNGKSGLATLEISGGTLTPNFSSSRLSYTLPAVPFTTSTVTVKARAANNFGTPATFARLNGALVEVPGGGSSFSSPLQLVTGPNTLEVRNIAANGFQFTSYSVSIVREDPNSDADLTNLTLVRRTATGSSSGAAFEPAFDRNRLNYTNRVENQFTTIQPIVGTSRRGAAVQFRMGDTAFADLQDSNFPLSVGTNRLELRVTSTDGQANKTYGIDVIRAAPVLNALSLSSGTLSPAFSPTTTSYIASVVNTVSALRVTATTAQAGATVRVNGGPGGTDIPLNVGENTIAVTVTAPDGSIGNYAVRVTRAASSDASLSALSLSSGTLSPAFSPTTTNYTASVANTVSALRVTATTAQAGATVRVNGGPAGTDIPLNVGDNTIAVNVTAPDGTTTRTYNVRVTRAASSDASLSALSLSNGTLSPAFSPTTTNYTASVANSVSSLRVTATTAQVGATVRVNGGPAGTDIPLNVGDNTIAVNVTAPDGTTTRTYNVRVTRARSNNANLQGYSATLAAVIPFALSPISLLTPDPAIKTYTREVGNRFDRMLSFSPFPADTNATRAVSVDGGSFTTLPNNSPGVNVPLRVGTTRVQVHVTAQDRVAGKTYTFDFKRLAGLSSLSLSSGTLSPAFDWRTTSYTATVAGDVNSILLTPSAANSIITVRANNSLPTSVRSGAKHPVALDLGANKIALTVTSLDGTSTKTYTVMITKVPSSNADLKALRLSTGTLRPVFAQNITNYTATVSAATSSIRIRPDAADANAFIRVKVNEGSFNALSSGELSNPLPLNPGSNTVRVELFAQDGTTTKAYTITVTRGS